MLYISTRGAADGKTFADITFEGIAETAASTCRKTTQSSTADDWLSCRGDVFKRCARSPFEVLDAAAAERSLAALPRCMAAIDLSQWAGYV